MTEPEARLGVTVSTVTSARAGPDPAGGWPWGPVAAGPGVSDSKVISSLSLPHLTDAMTRIGEVSHNRGPNAYVLFLYNCMADIVVPAS